MGSSQPEVPDNLIFTPLNTSEARAVKGGFYYPSQDLWLSSDFEHLTIGISPADRSFFNWTVQLGLTMGRIHLQQIQDNKDFKTWPKRFFGNVETFLKEKYLKYVTDPYAQVGEGKPFSKAYQSDCLEAGNAAIQLRYSGSDFVYPLKPYIDGLIKLYLPSRHRKSDFRHAKSADRAWAQIPSEARFLMMAEPAEYYEDPLCAVLEKDPRIEEWVKQVTEKQKLPPWKNYFEFFLAEIDTGPIDSVELDAIKQTSYRLFGESNKQAGITEYRKLLVATGHSASFPAVGISYPNFDDLDAKSIIFTNALAAGVIEDHWPIVQANFTATWTKQPEFLNQLIKGRFRAVIGHEENHSFLKLEDQALEEIKSTVNGINAIAKTGKVNSDELFMTGFAELVSALYIHKRRLQAIELGDTAEADTLAAQDMAGQLLLNYLNSQGGFQMQDGKVVDLDKDIVVSSILALSDLMVAVAKKQFNPAVSRFGEEGIWQFFNL